MSLDRSARGLLWKHDIERSIERTTGKAYMIVRDAANGACLGMVSDQDVLAALQSVPGPDGKTPLPGSGALSGLSIKGWKGLFGERHRSPPIGGARANACRRRSRGQEISGRRQCASQPDL